MTERSYERFLFYGAFMVSGAFAAGGWAWVWSALGDIPGPLILHFNDYNGINQIGSMAEVHGLGATGVIMVAVNFILAQALPRGERRWSGLLAGVTLFLAALLFTALAAIISVNK